MLGKAMRFTTVCTLALAICGKANRDKGAAGSKGTTENLEHRLMQETNFEDHLSKTSPCSRYRMLAVIPLLSSVATSANTAFAPILANNPLNGTRDMLRPVNANRANPNLATQQVSSHDIKLFATRLAQETARRQLFGGVTPFGLAGLEPPTQADVEAFRSLNKHKNSRARFKGPERPLKTRQFNILKECTGHVGTVAKELDLSPEEEAALWSYTHGDASIINQIARGADKVDFMDYSAYHRVAADLLCTLTKEDMLPWLKVLNAALNKLPIAPAGRLYRGVGFNAEGIPGSLAPIAGFASFTEDFDVAHCLAEEKGIDGDQPTIFVMDKHSSGRSLEQMDFPMDRKEVVFHVGTKFVIKEDQLVQQQVEALWRKNWASGTSYDGFNNVAGTPNTRWASDVFPVPDFKVLVVEEVPSDDA